MSRLFALIVLMAVIAVSSAQYYAGYGYAGVPAYGYGYAAPAYGGYYGGLAYYKK